MEHEIIHNKLYYLYFYVKIILYNTLVNQMEILKPMKEVEVRYYKNID